MAIAGVGQHAPARRALDQALLDEIGLDHVLDHVARFRERRGQRLDADRPAAVVLGDAARDSAGPWRRARSRRPRGASARRRRRRRRCARCRRPRRSRAPGASSRPATRGVPRARRAISAAPAVVRSISSTPAPRSTMRCSSAGAVEIEAQRNAEALAQRRGDQAGARGRADQREGRQVDAHRARRRPLADDEVELEVLHRRIEDLLDRRIEAVDLVDEQHVVRLQVGEQRGEVAGARDRPGRRWRGSRRRARARRSAPASSCRGPAGRTAAHGRAPRRRARAASMKTRRLSHALFWPTNSARRCGRSAASAPSPSPKLGALTRSTPFMSEVRARRASVMRSAP